jgi:dihydrodiol dehydrogenase / D-xylose 1-dehydrogenase (NADP)
MAGKTGPTKWGILGAGNISHDWAVGLSTLPRAEHQILGVAARKLESAEKFSKEHNIPKAYGSYEELLKNPEIGKGLYKYKKDKTYGAFVPCTRI